MRVILLVVLMLSVIAAVQADTAADLAAAKASFGKAQAFVSTRINALEQERRTAIWEQYYRAREHLRRMEIHQQMIQKHGQDRSAQFEQSLTEFGYALQALQELLPDS